MPQDRPDPRVTALTYLTPTLLGVHSTLLPWLTVEDDGAEEMYSFWGFTARSVFEDSAIGPVWFVVLLLGIGVTIVGGFRATAPEAGPSRTAAAAAAVLALLVLALPLQMAGAIDAVNAPGTEETVRWGGPLTLAAAAIWFSRACLSGRRGAR